MPANICRASHSKFEVHCDELEGHAPIIMNGLKWEHFNHTVGRGWNDNGTWVSVPKSRSFEAELLAELPAHTYAETRELPPMVFLSAGMTWIATFTTPAGGWTIYRPTSHPEPRVTIRGQGIKVQLANPTVEIVVETLRLHGALDDPAVTGVSWEARRWLAAELNAYAVEGTKRLGRDITSHDEAHLNGMSAAVAWLRGELGLPVAVIETDATLARDAWELISKAHGGQPWEAHGDWRDRATGWRNAYRRNNPSPELLEAAASLIGDVVGNQGDAWEEPSYAWRKRYDAWREATRR